ncbi:hypothetical protein CGH44_21735 [Vibrio parahaemolyticus]|nr:hypothetical protein CGH44_21735 [Vibrio parahaemolyticus]
MSSEDAQRIELMLSMNYTQREIAERLGISKSAVNNYAKSIVK